MSENQDFHNNGSRSDKYSSRNWIGILFVLLGIYLLLQTTHTIEAIDNWWAFFILIPGIATYFSAYQQYRESSVITVKLIDRITSGTITVFVACVFLFEWSWSEIWPVFLIIIGLEYLLKHKIRNNRHN